MSDEAEGGTIEAAVAQIQEARAEAAKPEPKTQQAPEPAAEVATVEAEESPPEQLDAADADTPEVEADAEPVSTIDAPASFTPEEKEMFKALPPEQQQSVLRLAKGAQAAESRRQNEHQAALQQAQARAQAAEQERQYFSSALQQYKNPIVADYQREFADVLSGQTDVLRLSQDPQRWPRYQAYQTTFAQIGQQEQMLAQQAERDESERLQKHVETRNSQLIEAKPELKDPDKFDQFDAEISTYLRELKIPDERIMRVSFEELTIIEKAMKWDKAQKAKAIAKGFETLARNRAERAQGNVRQMPRVMKPGMGNSAGAADDKIAAIDQRAQKTGSVQDAAARIRARLGRSA